MEPASPREMSHRRVGGSARNARDQGPRQRAVRSRDEAVQEAVREGGHSQRAQAPRVLRQAERSQEEEGGSGAQTCAQEDAQNGALSARNSWVASPKRSSIESAIAWTS